MTEKFRVLDGEVDLEHEDVRDSQNRRIAADYAQRAVADVHTRRGRRPQADDTPVGEHSPRVSFRIPEQIRRCAEERGIRYGWRRSRRSDASCSSSASSSNRPWLRTPRRVHNDKTGAPVYRSLSVYDH
jgi:hypothetical protein